MSALTTPVTYALEGQHLPSLLDAYERALILASLAAAEGHQRRAAQMLGIRATTLNEKLKRLGLRDVVLVPGTQRPTATALPTVQDEFRWRGRLRQGNRLEVSAVNGNVHVAPAPGDEVEVVAVRHLQPGGSAALGIDVVVAELQAGLRVEARYQAREAVLSSHVLLPEELRVDFHVRVPADVVLDVRTLNGDVEVHGLTGSLRAWSARGSVTVATR